MRPPSVDKVARSISDVDLPQPLLVQAAREAIAAAGPDTAGITERARDIALGTRRALLGPAVNATGVLLHTNLGRAPLAPPAAPDAAAPARASNLEFDLAAGTRGSRHVHASRLLAELTGAEAAVVVNNCAAAVMLVLAALASGRGVAVSRGELVEIGGGFRVPDVLAQSGARLVEVGTTNRTRVADYRHAHDTSDVALLLKVHPSNYRISGFTEEAGVAELAAVGPPVAVDLGSGLLDERCDWLGVRPEWLRHEPGVRQTLEAGAAVVTFSGDKLLGGPQAGVICGRKTLVDACAAHPLMRAVRPGSLVLAELQRTALAYLRRDGDAIPFWRMAAVPVERLRERAAAMADAAGVGRPVDTEALAGAGSLPDQVIPSAGLQIPGDIAAALRAHSPPVIARVRDQSTVADLRTVDPLDDDVVGEAVRAATAGAAARP
ncbi:MAG TPA: L-seryl-tRNA(Sec) selenium transferase [Acidimicrobiaceae bacterium]|nr:L-seryl-tRNA(Sec) selenium transferase [Acidimicrobiaceae bacterium]